MAFDEVCLCSDTRLDLNEADFDSKHTRQTIVVVVLLRVGGGTRPVASKAKYCQTHDDPNGMGIRVAALSVMLLLRIVGLC
jgi:hypothetical protein